MEERFYGNAIYYEVQINMSVCYVTDDLGEAWAEEVVARGGRVVRVTYPRTANNDKELTVVRGEYLEVGTQAKC